MEIPTGFVEKARFVRVIFTDVEREYDLLLHLLTLGMDWAWRRRLFARITPCESNRILDLACGTGLVTFPLQRLVGSGGLVVGLDPSVSMLQPAVRRKHLKGVPVEFVRAVGESMPFRDGVFDYETVGLALRNFGDKEAMFREAHRTLRNGGWFLSVDFVLPSKSLIRKLYLFYVLKVFPGAWEIGFGKLASNIRVLGKVNSTLNLITIRLQDAVSRGLWPNLLPRNHSRSCGTCGRPKVKHEYQMPKVASLETGCTPNLRISNSKLGLTIVEVGAAVLNPEDTVPEDYGSSRHSNWPSSGEHDTTSP